jgi:hypothetical protein
MHEALSRREPRLDTPPALTGGRRDGWRASAGEQHAEEQRPERSEAAQAAERRESAS